MHPETLERRAERGRGGREGGRGGGMEKGEREGGKLRKTGRREDWVKTKGWR